MAIENEERAWEKHMGKDVVERTQLIAQDSANYRKNLKLPPTDNLVQENHNLLIHKIGAESLRSKVSRKEEQRIARANLAKKQSKVAKLLRRKIKVTDLEDGGVSVSIDQEWDTSTWTNEQIEAGSEALVLIFYESQDSGGIERKERAVQMLQKLLSRHPVAIDYMRRNIEIMIGKAASKLITRGRTAGVLNLLYVLNSCKENFVVEMSHFDFNSRAMEMLLQEARLAAMLLQHFFRSYLNRRRVQKLKEQGMIYDRIMRVLSITQEFGSDLEIKMTKLLHVNARSRELRLRWRIMHKHSRPRSLNKTAGGLRGPIHVDPVFTTKALEIILHLISANVGKLAQGNREDVVRANGCILLSTFVGCASGHFSRISVEILANISRTAESLQHILKTGCIGSCLRLMKHLRIMFGIGTFNLKEKKGDERSPMRAFMHCIDVVINTGVHAAGLYRASHGYHFLKEAREEVERVDYSFVLRHHYAGAAQAMYQEVQSYLGDKRLLQEMSQMLCSTKILAVQQRLLLCFLCITCTAAHHNVHGETAAMAGTLIARLVELMTSTRESDGVDEMNGTLALSILMQLCTQTFCRQAYVESHVVALLYPHIQGMSTPYKSAAQERALLACVVMLRQVNWWFYDPQELPVHLMQPGALRQVLLLDLLKTIKNPELFLADKLNVADLILLPTHESTAEKMAKLALQVGAKEIVNYVCHPEEEWFYESLAVEEAAAVCTILDSFALCANTAKAVYSPGVINFLGKFLYLAKYSFLGKPMLDAQIMIVLNGVRSATAALGKFGMACKDSPGEVDSYLKQIRACDIVNSGLFFMNTLSVSHENLDKYTRELQRLVGMSCLEFFTGYAAIIARVHVEKGSSLEDLNPIGIAVLKLFPYLKTVHAKSRELVPMFSKMCCFLYEATVPKSGAYTALQEWGAFEGLRIYLPLPLSGMLRDAEMNAIAHRLKHSSLLSVDLRGNLPVRSAHSGNPGHPMLGGGLEDRSEVMEEDASRPSSVARSFLLNESMGSSATGQLAAGKASRDVDKYSMSLIDLPSQFFELCSNLCQIEKGRSICFTDGYLRRALDKVSIIHVQYLDWKNLVGLTVLGLTAHNQNMAFAHTDREGPELASTANSLMVSRRRDRSRHGMRQQSAKSETFRTNTAAATVSAAVNAAVTLRQRQQAALASCAALSPDAKAHTIACLRLIGKVGSFTNPKVGSAHDLIFNNFFSVIEVCRDYIDCELLERNDPLVEVAFETVASLSADVYRVSVEIEKCDFYSTVQDQLLRAELLTANSAACALTTIQNSCSHLTSDYIKELALFLRAPIARVMRVYPKLSVRVRETLWALTKSVMIYRTHVPGDDLEGEDPEEIAFEAFVRSGVSHSASEAATWSKSPTGAQLPGYLSPNVALKPIASEDSFAGSPYGTPHSQTPHTAAQAHTAAASSPIMEKGTQKSHGTNAGYDSSFSAALAGGSDVRSNFSPMIKAASYSLIRSPGKPAATVVSTLTKVHMPTSSLLPTAAAISSPSPLSLSLPKPVANPQQDEESPDPLGSYHHCGVTTCGSLKTSSTKTSGVASGTHRLMKPSAGDITHDSSSTRASHSESQLHLDLPLHSSASRKASSKREKSSSSFPAGDDDAYETFEEEFEEEVNEEVLPLSQLSAREKSLRDEVAFRKARMGFAEKIMYDPYLKQPSKGVNTGMGGGKGKKKGNDGGGDIGGISSSSGSKGAERERKRGVEGREGGKVPGVKCLSLHELPDLILTKPPKR